MRRETADPAGQWPEAHALTGAYVCDALDAAERSMLASHLARCPVCTQEVAELREAAALLAMAAAETPPARLKAAVLARIAMTGQVGAGVRVVSARRAAGRRPWFSRAGRRH